MLLFTPTAIFLDFSEGFITMTQVIYNWYNT